MILSDSFLGMIYIPWATSQRHEHFWTYIHKLEKLHFHWNSCPLFTCALLFSKITSIKASQSRRGPFNLLHVSVVGKRWETFHWRKRKKSEIKQTLLELRESSSTVFLIIFLIFIVLFCLNIILYYSSILNKWNFIRKMTHKDIMWINTCPFKKRI